MTCDEFRRECRVFWDAGSDSPLDGTPAGATDAAFDHCRDCWGCYDWVGSVVTCDEFRDRCRLFWTVRTTTPDYLPNGVGCGAVRHYGQCRACQEWWWPYAEDRRHAEMQLLTPQPGLTDRTELDRERTERRAEMLADDAE